MGWFENLYSTDGKFDLAKAATSAAGLATLYGAVKPDSSVGEFLGMSSAQQPVGYTGGIPEYEISREVLPGAFAATTAEGTPRRPGSMGRRYFTDTTFTPTGGVMEAGSMPAAQTTTPTTQGLLGQLPPEAVAGLLGALTGMFGGVAGGRSAVAEDQQGFVAQPTGGAPAVVAAAPTAGTVTEAPAQSPTALQQFLQPFYGKTLGAADVLALGDSDFSLADIAAGLGLSAESLSGAYTNLANQRDVSNVYGGIEVDNQYTQEEYDAVADLVKSGKASITNVAEQFNTTPEVVADRLLTGGAMTPDGGAMTPDELLTYYQPYNPDMTMEGLMGWLASTGETTVKEIADLFPEYTEAEIGYALIDRGYATPSQLATQYPDLSAEEATEIYRSMGGTKYAGGGLASLGGQGYYLGGPTDGMADLIPATIDGNQPAALSDGEFVIPADVVSHLGNGNSDAGAQQLYSMMDRVRQERTGTTRQGPEINPTKMMPA